MSRDAYVTKVLNYLQISSLLENIQYGRMPDSLRDFINDINLIDSETQKSITNWNQLIAVMDSANIAYDKNIGSIIDSTNI